MVNPKSPPKVSSSDQFIARAMRPSQAYDAVVLMLHDGDGAGSAINAVASRGLDGLDIEVRVRCEDPDPAYDAEISLRSRRAAEEAIGMMAQSVDRCSARLRADTIAALLADVECTLVSAPQSWREVATLQGVLPLWHAAAATLGGLANVVAWSSTQDPAWVQWFTDDFESDFFATPAHVDGVLAGMDALPRRGKAGAAATEIAQLWASALLRSAPALPRLHSLGVHDRLKGASRQSLAYLVGQGWSPDPCVASWADLLSLQRPADRVELPFSRELGPFLGKHMDTLARLWPDMARKPPGEISVIESAEQVKACTGVSLWHLLASVLDTQQHTALAARLQSHALSLATPVPRLPPTTPRF